MKDDRYYEVIEGVFPSDKVVTLGNYQLQYVTTRKSAAKPAAATGTNAPAATHSEPTTSGHADAGHEHAGAAISPLLWMGITLAVLLLANVIAILLRKRAATPAPQEPTPANAVDHGVASTEVSSK